MKTGGASDFFQEQKINPEYSNQIWQASSIGKKTYTNEEFTINNNSLSFPRKQYQDQQRPQTQPYKPSAINHDTPSLSDVAIRGRNNITCIDEEIKQNNLMIQQKMKLQEIISKSSGSNAQINDLNKITSNASISHVNNTALSINEKFLQDRNQGKV